MLFALLAGCSSSTSPDEATPQPANILVVLVDDIGVDKLDLYGLAQRTPSTPRINAFAQTALRFDAAYAYPSCTPTRAALMTGRFTRRFGIGAAISARKSDREIPLDEIFLPELLSAANPPYESAAVGKWHMASQASPSAFEHPVRQGFQGYSGAFGNLGHPDTDEDYFRFEKRRQGQGEFVETYATSDTIDDAVQRLQSMQPPWFLYVSLNAPHAPFHVPPAELRSSEVDGSSSPPDLYDAAVEAIDHEFGRLLDALPADLRRSTTIVLLGDNGTDGNAVRPPQLGTRAKKSLYEGGVHVPLLISSPKVTDPGGRREQLVHVVDFFPTFAELAGARFEHEVDGQSLLPILADPAAPGRSYVLAERFRPHGPPPYSMDEVMLRNQRWKLIRRQGAADEFFEFESAIQEEGRNLLRAPLSAEGRRAYEELDAELNRLLAEITP